jgi:hypothetical protein
METQRITMDQGSSVWISEDFKIILQEALNGQVGVLLGFPRMNEVQVRELFITVSRRTLLGEDAQPLPLGIFGRDLVIQTDGWTRIPDLAVSVVLRKSEGGLKRAKFEVAISDPRVMVPI